MHLLVDVLALVRVGARIGELRFDLRVAKLLERVLEKHLRRALLREVHQVLIVLPAQVAVDLQEAREHVVGRDLFIRRVARDCGHDTVEKRVVERNRALSVRLREDLVIDGHDDLVPRRVAREHLHGRSRILIEEHGEERDAQRRVARDAGALGGVARVLDVPDTHARLHIVRRGAVDDELAAPEVDEVEGGRD